MQRNDCGNPPAEHTGMLLVGHGTRDQRGIDEFLKAAELVARREPDVDVQPCFLEIAEPTIARAVADLAGKGARRLVVSPLLLFAAGHANHDIPQAVGEAVASHRFDSVRQAAVLGRHPQLVALSKQRYDECLIGRGTVPPERTLLLMLGRGSPDATAVAEMLRFSAARGRQSGVGQLRTAFFAMAQPSLEKMIDEVRLLPVDRVVVQPHLLFQGHILQRLRERVAEIDRTVDHQEWIAADHLGPAPPLADAVVDRFRQAAQAPAVQSAR